MITASVIIEWYNLTYAELGRVRRMLAELRSQAIALHSSDESAPVRLAEPLDLVITFDSERNSVQQIQSTLGELANPSDSLVPRFLPVADSNYCKLKNAGAANSKGEIIIFLDSDVIPEPNWLAAFLGAFASPGVAVVVGNTYVDCIGLSVYAKSMALTWMFPLRDSSDGLTLSTCFYANNVAFRREVFLSRQFPDVPGLTHAPAALMVERLQRDGVALWHAGGARASHPPPNGLVHFSMRAIAGGRARAFSRRTRGITALMQWIRADSWTIIGSCKKIAFDSSPVGLRWWQIPSAMLYPITYYALFYLGSLLSIAFPRLMRNRFQL